LNVTATEFSLQEQVDDPQPVDVRQSLEILLYALHSGLFPFVYVQIIFV
jgi:hypothetical protein